MHTNTNTTPDCKPDPLVPARATPAQSSSEAQLRAKYLCQDCGEAAPSGFGVCRQCERFYA